MKRLSLKETQITLNDSMFQWMDIVEPAEFSFLNIDLTTAIEG